MARLKQSSIESEDGRRRPVTLGELVSGDIDVFCWCNRCAHNDVVPSERLLAQLGPAIPVPEIGARMRCSGCSSKDIATRPSWPSLGTVARHT